MHPGCDVIYFNLEMTKKSNAPCADTDYLKGLLQIAKTLALTKRVIISGIDQSAFLVFAHSGVSVALNPHISYRKNDVDDKLSSDTPGGGPKPEDRRQRIYLPELLNDLDITRDLQDPDFASLNSKLKLGDKSSIYFADAHQLANDKARNKHFTYVFGKQMSDYIDTNREASITLIGEKISGAQKVYANIEANNILLDRDSRGNFLDSWADAHSNCK